MCKDEKQISSDPKQDFSAVSIDISSLTPHSEELYGRGDRQFPNEILKPHAKSAWLKL
jgi:hypothetical protein